MSFRARPSARAIIPPIVGEPGVHMHAGRVVAGCRPTGALHLGAETSAPVVEARLLHDRDAMHLLR